MRKKLYDILNDSYSEVGVENMMDNSQFDFHFEKLIESIGLLQWEYVKEKALVG